MQVVIRVPISPPPISLSLSPPPPPLPHPPLPFPHPEMPLITGGIPHNSCIQAWLLASGAAGVLGGCKIVGCTFKSCGRCLHPKLIVDPLSLMLAAAYSGGCGGSVVVSCVRGGHCFSSGLLQVMHPSHPACNSVSDAVLSGESVAPTPTSCALGTAYRPRTTTVSPPPRRCPHRCIWRVCCTICLRHRVPKHGGLGNRWRKKR
jgi:hypothetical protein